MDKKQVMLITGGMGEIATAIIRQLAGRVGVIAALDIANVSDAKSWLANLETDGITNVIYRKMDVTSFAECKKVIGAIADKYKRIDYLVNNAGITRDAVFYKMTEDDWNAVLGVNLDGMFNVTRNAIETMRMGESGRIVNISSVNGQRGQFSQANYAASKAGIYGFTKTLAQELIARHITVNSISPGYVDTHLMQGIRPDILGDIIAHIPARRLARPEEIAWVVDFLLDDRSRYITGANININGGMYMD